MASDVLDPDLTREIFKDFSSQEVINVSGAEGYPGPRPAVLHDSRQPLKIREVLMRLARSATSESQNLLNYLISKRKLAEVSDEDEYISWDRACRVLSRGGSLSRLDIVYFWAMLLNQWSSHATSPTLSSMRYEAAIERYVELLRDEEATSDQKAIVLCTRALSYWLHGELDRAIADFTAVEQMSDVQAEWKMQALIGRGGTYSQRGKPHRTIEDFNRAIEDYSSVIQRPDATADQRAVALIGRGDQYSLQSKHDRAIADYSVVIQMPEAPDIQKLQSLARRGWQHYLADHWDEAIADNRQAIALATTLKVNDWRVHANLAVALLVRDRVGDALAAYDAALNLVDLTNLDEMSKDLSDAIQKHSQLPGAEQVLARLESRRNVLNQQAMNQTSGSGASSRP